MATRSRQRRLFNPPKDPYYPSVALLLPMNGGNGSTTFTDYSPSPVAVTPSGPVSISSAQSRFGGSSGYFNGSAARLTIADSPALNFGSGDFTIEFHFNSSGSTYYALMLSNLSNSYGGIRIDVTANRIWWLMSENGTWAAYTYTDSGGAITNNRWYHFALVRSGNTIYSFLDGTQTYSPKTFTGSVYSSPNHYLGSIPIQAEFYKGYLAELRLTKGVARYVSNFTPPASPFPKS